MKARIREVLEKLKENKISKREALEQIRAIKQPGTVKRGIVFTRRFTHDDPYLKAHVVFGEQILLGVTHCSLAIEALRELYPGENDSSIHLHKFVFHRPVVVNPGETVEIGVDVRPTEGKTAFRNLYRELPGQDYKETASGEYIPGSRYRFPVIDISSFRSKYDRFIPGEAIAKNKFLDRYPALKTVQNAYVRGDEILGEMVVTREVENSTYRYHVHPALVDGGFIVSVSNLPGELLREGELHQGMWVPFMVKDLYVNGPLGGKCFSHSKVVKAGSNLLEVDFSLADETGQVQLVMKGFSFKYVSKKEFLNSEKSTPQLLPEAPLDREKPAEPAAPGRSHLSIEKYLAGKVAALIGSPVQAIMEQIDKNFMELGVDSNTLIVLSEEIGGELGIELYPTLFFERQDIGELAEYFLKEHEEAVSRYFNITGSNGNSNESFDQTFSKVWPPAGPPEAEKDIAVIGMAGCFAQSPNLHRFWENLKSGKDMITEIPLDHFDWRPWYDENRDAANKTYCKWGSFIEVDKFDPVFFGITPREAIWLDPQFRVLLEVIHTAVEDAGYGRKIQGTSTGVFVGVCYHDYWDEIVRSQTAMVDYQSLSSFFCSIPGRLSYIYDLHGMSVPVDNACASSLTAMHLACNALRNGECEMAFTAGVNMILSPFHYVNFARVQALSPTGRCHTFDKSADGYVPGEGAAALLLKPLKKAVRDGDNIYAVIKGTAANHVGKSNNPTAPRPEWQTRLLVSAWKDAGIDPGTLTYIEAHGTGTSLGDPIEWNALKKAFGQFTTKKGFCHIGSVKAHIGHLEGAAGIAGVVKAILSLKHRQIPAMPNFKEINPYIGLEDSPFIIDTKLQSWEAAPGEPRRVGVSSFGMTGHNAHVVLEEYTPRQKAAERPAAVGLTDKEMVFVLSARSPERLGVYAGLMAGFLEGAAPGPALADVIYTLQEGREAMEERLALVVSEIAELKEKLNRYSRQSGLEEIERGYRGTVKPGMEKPRGPGNPNEVMPDQLARLWVSGADIDWKMLYPDRTICLVPLPTYPFVRQRYWKPVSPAAPVTPGSSMTGSEDFLYIPTWRMIAPPMDSSSSANSKGEGARCILIIYHEGSTAFKNWLRDEMPGEEIIEFKLGEDVQSMDKTLRQIKNLHMIYFLGGMEPGEIDAHDLGKLEESQERGVLSLYRWIKALDRGGLTKKPVGLTVITHQVQRVLPGDRVRPYAASLYGLVKAIAAEYTKIRTLTIDIDTAALNKSFCGGPGGSFFKKRPLVAEGSRNEIAIRGGKVYERVLNPLRLPPVDRAPFRKSGVYLIVGGAGGIGLEFSRYLAETVQARLILVGRSELNGHQKEKIAEIETRGGEVVYLQADVTDPGDMQTVMQKAKTRFGRVNGVIHSAVVTRDQVIAGQEEADFIAGMAPKVRGSVVLANAVGEEALDFMMFFSSGQSFSGRVGVSYYIAGSTFEDAYAQYLNQEKPYPVIVINWGYWGRIGTGDNEFIVRQFSAQGVKVLHYEEGMESLKRILGHGVDQVMPFKGENTLLEKMGVDLSAGVELYPMELPSVVDAAAGRIEAESNPPVNDMAEVTRSYNLLEEFLHRLLLAILQKMGVFRRKGEHYRFEELRQELKITPGYFKLYEALVGILAGAGFIRKEGGDIVTTVEIPQLSLDSLEEEKQRLMERYPGIIPHLKLGWACLTAYPEVLSGKKNHMEAMFPGGSKELVEGIYTENPAAENYNRLTARVVDAYIRERLQKEGNSKITILEVGAGTGGTSRDVLNAIKPYAANLTYYYTDISLGFTNYGADRYGKEYPFVEFRVLDIEDDPGKQGYQPGRIDLVLASNVVHATKRIDHTLRRIKRLLKANGILVLNEVTRAFHFTTLTFGLTGGWWQYEDSDIRLGGAPVLSSEAWKQILEINGFRGVRVFGNPAGNTPAAETAGAANPAGKPGAWQHVIIGESDGYVSRETQPRNRENSQAGESHLQPNPGYPGETGGEIQSFSKVLKQPPGIQAVYSASPPGTGIAGEGPVNPGTGITEKDLEERTCDYIKRIFSEVIKIDSSEIDPQATFERYGVDSLVSMELVKRLEADFGRLDATLLYENKTIRQLTGYFLSGRREELENKFKITREHPGESAPSRDIAIIGVNLRFPYAENLDDYWENLENGRDCIREIPPDRWDNREFYDPNPGTGAEGKMYCKWGSFIEDVDKFDPMFFQITPREAERMDPQERLFLQAAWWALEDAGYTREELQRNRRDPKSDAAGAKVGVFAGATTHSYHLAAIPGSGPGNLDIPTLTPWTIPNRVSYLFNFQGPSIPVDTACSSSLTAIHLACESLEKGECDIAIAGGINLYLHPSKYYAMCKNGMLSPTGRCHTFGKDADGFVPGEGVGVVVLKPKERAIGDGDHIYAVIKGSAVNHGGKTGGYTVPNPNAQAELIESALEAAKIDPQTITCIEAHGTGTELGDPIEINGLSRAFRRCTDKKQYCSVGSVKSNIGHLESAAGIAGLLKVVAQMKHKKLAPSLHADELNPKIDFASSPFYVQRTLEKWEPPYPRRAGISSFGAGGANAHIILEEYEEPDTRHEAAVTGPHLIVLSAQNRDRLKEKAGNMAKFLEKEQVRGYSLRAVAYTLQEGREAMKERMAMVVSTIGELKENLHCYCRGETHIQNVYTGNIKAGREIKSFDQTFSKGGWQSQPIKDEAGLPEAEQLSGLARHWVSGGEIDWKKLYPGGQPQRVSLPGYPFAGERYWIDTHPGDKETDHEPSAVTYYRSQWEREEIGDCPSTGEFFTPGHVIVVNPPGEMEKIPGLLQVKYGSRYIDQGEGVYEIDPKVPGDYHALFETLSRQECYPGRVIFCGPREMFPGEALESGLQTRLEKGIYSVFHCTQAMMMHRRKPGEKIRLVYLYSTTAGGTDPVQAGVGGYARVLRMENPGYLYKIVQVQEQEQEQGQEQGREQAREHGQAQQEPFGKKTGKSRPVEIEIGMKELDAPFDPMEIKYDENGRRYVQRLKELGPAGEPAAQPLKTKGVYLITGGQGGLGLIFARRLAHREKARLVLVGRSGMDAGKEAAIKELENRGAEVIYLQADISDRSEVEKLAKEIKTRYNRLNGIIHSAGVVHDAFILKKTAEQMRCVLAPKVQGTLNLDEVFKDEKLEFFAMCASLSGVLGNVGQADYAYANRFMDEFAQWRDRQRRENKRFGITVTIDWPRWEEGGMYVGEEDRNAASKQAGLEGMPTAEGLNAFENALISGQPQCIVIYGNRRKVETFFGEGIFQLKANSKNSIEGARAAGLAAGGINSALLAEKTGRLLKKIFGEALKIPAGRIDMEVRFEEYGVDSILVKVFNAKIENELGQVPKTLLFEYQTLNQLADYLVSHYRERLIRYFGRESGLTSNTVDLRKMTQNKSFSGVQGSAVRGAYENPSAPDSSEPYHHSAFITHHSTSRPLAAGTPSMKGEKEDRRDIAVIGVSGRYPQAPTLDEFWENLKTGKDSITEIPISRWDYRDYFSPEPTGGKMYCKWGGFLEEVDRFDPLFFNISPHDAEYLDPQERIFLETAWAVLEDAGYTREAIKNSQGRETEGEGEVGVFAGITSYTYHMWAQEEGQFFPVPSSIANRVSFALDFHGPSMPVDTACSSSLTAVHLACESLKKGESRMAIAGGVNLYLHPYKYIGMCAMGFLSRTGKCHTFGQGADGFVPGEGVGAVLLKPLPEAIKDRDHIYAVIKGSTINHGGRTNGYTVPNPNAQANLVMRALTEAGINPADIGYVEAHGTGTSLGDPIEIAGLTKAYGKYTREKHYCSIGSVKTNIGHLEAAAGIAGMTKVILQMKHKQLVPTLNADPLNPAIDFENSPFYVQQGLTGWSRGRRIAAVSSFGAAGANAHVILEAYEDQPTGPQPAVEIYTPSPHLIVMSAQNTERLKVQAGNMVKFLEKYPQPDYTLPGIAYTLQEGRESMPERIAAVVSTTAEMKEKLTGYCRGAVDQENFYTGNSKAGQAKPMILMEGGEGEEFIRRIIAGGKLDKIAQLWLTGEPINWNLLYPGGTPNRVSLPTYPFAGERYWIQQGQTQGPAPGPGMKTREPKEVETKTPAPARTDPALLTGKTVTLLREVFAGVLKLPASRIDPAADFKEYGLDSITITRFNAKMEQKISQLPRTLLFEYRTIHELGAYLEKNNRQELEKLLGVVPGEAEGKQEEGKETGQKNRPGPGPGITPPEREVPRFLLGRQSTKGARSMEIAIIGVSGRYPQAANLAEYWENLKAGRDCITEIPASRWDNRRYYDPDPAKAMEGKIYCKWGGFIDEIDRFDPLLFGISPKEAENIDPQERLFLESAWTTLEDAGYTRKRLTGEKRTEVGVYAGATTFTYQYLGMEEWQRGNKVMPTSSPWSIANRVSYVMNFNGPSIPVDTACSASLTAVHMACESLRNHECRMAIAGGVNLYLHPGKYVLMCRTRMLSPTGKCYTFGEKSDGFVPGEGVGTVLLKPLAAAKQEGDHIYAVIKGSAVNHGGTTSGYTVPNPNAQAALIHEALKKAGIDPRTISYVEAHGTGTMLGDPVEIAGITKAYRAYTNDSRYCSIGSVKTNIGHLESAAGIAGITKILLQMKYQQLVPTLYADPANPNIDFERTPFYVQAETTGWRAPANPRDREEKNYPRRAAISSFGVGGANAHVILEEYKPGVSAPTGNPDRGPQVILLSARNPERLKAYAGNLVEFLGKTVNPVTQEGAGSPNPGRYFEPSGGSLIGAPGKPVIPSEPRVPRERLSFLQAFSNHLQKDLITIAAGILHVAPGEIQPGENFLDCGYDPLLLAKLAETINRKYDIEVTPAVCHGEGTIGQLCRYLGKEYAGQMSAYYSKHPGEPTADAADEAEAAEIDGIVEIVERREPPLEIERIAYTLQVGREEMAERLAVVAAKIDELKEKLTRYCRGDRDIPDLYPGNVKTMKQGIQFLLEGEDGTKILREFTRDRKLHKLAQLWVSGIEVDWEQLYPGKPQRISLPTYPFARERCWIKETSPAFPGESPHRQQREKLHPLVGVNESTLQEQKFTTRLEGSEFYLEEHVVAGQKVLPGVVYLEMARAAGEIAGEKRVRKIKNIIWARPIIVDPGPRDVQINLNPDAAGAGVDYEVSTREEDDHRTVHARGKLIYCQEASGAEPGPKETIDIAGIKKRCRQMLDGNECYRLFKKGGLEYGPSFQVIREMVYDENESLTHLRQPPAGKQGEAGFELHPSLMDGALQTVLGVMGIEDKRGSATPTQEGTTGYLAALPFMLGEMEIRGPLPGTGYAYVTKTGETSQEAPGKEGKTKFQIMLLDEAGQVLVKMKDFTVRALPQEKRRTGPRVRRVLFHGVWKEAAAPATPYRPAPNQRLLILGSGTELGRALPYPLEQVILVKPGPGYKESGRCSEKAAARPAQEGPSDHLSALLSERRGFSNLPGRQHAFMDNCCCEINPGDYDDYRKLLAVLNRDGQLPDRIIHCWTGETAGEGLETQLEKGIYSLFYLTKAIMEQKPGKNIQLLYVYPEPGGEAPPALEAVSGFIRAVRLENPKLMYKTVAQEGEPRAEVLSAELHPGTAGDIEVRYREGKRYVKAYTEIPRGGGEQKPLPLREKGVYLITGGTGGLGMIFAEYLAKKTRATLVLAGRTPLSAAKEALLNRLKTYAAEVTYIEADIAQRSGVEKLVREVKTRYLHINGIIHSAGVIRDAFILKKTRAQVDEVLAPKVNGTTWLDEATKNEPLDFFVLFSSASGILGNIGQGDYAYANRYMDCYARARETLRKSGQRQGKTLSIDWPLWKEGGMKVDGETLAWLEKKSGIIPLETEMGLDAFETALALEIPVVAIAVTKQAGLFEQKLLEPAIFNPGKTPGTEPAEPPPPTGKEKVEKDLALLFVELLKVKESDLEKDEELGNYGMDSIMMMTVLNRLEKMYGKVVDPNALVENSTLEKLAAYLVDRGKAGQEREEFPGAEPQQAHEKNPGEKKPGEDKLPREQQPQKTRWAGRPLKTTRTENSAKIAVIGMASRFPRSNRLEDYWENLKNGIDLVTEVPADRWEVAAFYSPDKQAENKSYSKWGAFLTDVYAFDAGYFGVGEEDALAMDPHHRILLELTAELFTRAGYTREEVGNTRTGVYIGGGESNYADNHRAQIPDHFLKHIVVNNSQNMMAGRISDFFNLKGPSWVIDTACSSVLVAIHQASQGIRAGECEMAVSGGIELMLDPRLHIGFSKAGVLSDDGLAYVFDEKAKGFALGEGAGVILLKSYEAALRDGDNIQAVILGSAVNNDGRTMGITVPNLEGQKDVIQQALARSGVSAETISYLEAHGTGTLLGDPIEIKAAAQVYMESTREKQYCAVGSVKSNLGHLLRAAAVPGFIKLVLALQNQMIPPTLHCTRPHPRFRFRETPFYPVTQLTPWQPRSGKRRAAISSFGFGGTNCHMILEEYQGAGTEPRTGPKRTPHPLPQFNRKQYCLGKTIAGEPVQTREKEPGQNPEEEAKQTPEEEVALDETFYLELIDDIRKGKIEPTEAVEVVKLYEGESTIKS